MGCGILTTYTQIANIAGIHGLMVYTISGAIPIFLFSLFGPLIRKKCPDGFVLTEWVFQRFGPVTALYLSAFTVFTMFLYMLSELTAIEYAIEALTGLDATPAMVVQCVVTTIYTFFGGFQVSFVTDSFQAVFVLVLLVVGVIAYATQIDINLDIKHATQDQLMHANKLGWMLMYILPVAIITNDCFIAGFWLRTFAAKTNKDLVIGSSIAAVVTCIICTLVGLPGIIAVWTGDMQIYDDEGANAFFILVSKMDNWVIGVILIFSIGISTATFDSLQSATASTISNDFFRNKVAIMWVRFLVIVIMVPSLVVAIKAATNVLQIYLIADLVSASVIPIIFLGLSEKFNFLRGLDVMIGGLGALVAVFIYGTIYYGNAKDGARLLLVWNGLYSDQDWGAFGAFVIAPVGGILIGFASAAIRISIRGITRRIRGTRDDESVEVQHEMIDTDDSIKKSRLQALSVGLL
ncbi:hypothetical protein OGAPHI_006672 [Ogataea philodendri]|uniref:Urea transport protein n=1 Tax=Ogataea philodendri TaxID=1378263 RepID=A0A9P8T0V6_9ASCO|nr:uncharacterized protein OGAPHI_006672 [Ogataea philodendri]KAH3661265.1 hypothetical protein OGAPHI_006672 [Ogataea philodendri]